MNNKWWQKAVFYQIYPRSFADGNGDGIGDFSGMIGKLEYLQRLGIDAVWLSPHYPSPFLDCGYDISDYTAVAAEYGTLKDFKTFLHEAHVRDIRVVLDLVLNHSSDQHAWFQESRSRLDNPKRDWYIWRDGRNGGPPNNWASIFGGSAWEFDAATNQYYYHAFLKEQPDLNWRNPEVKRAMWDVVRFWLELGVDGFRLDALATTFEHPDLPNHDAPFKTEEILDANAFHKDEYMQLLRYQIKQPGLHELMQELRSLVDEYPGDRVLIGEDEDVAFHGTGDNELHLLFNFPLMQVKRLTPAHIRANQALRLTALPPGAWPCNTLGHHDVSRVWSHYGDGVNDGALARLHLALLLTLKGTPFIYNGDEIGMTDLKLSQLSEVRDSASLNQYRLLTEKLGAPHEDALKTILATTRDSCRSPLQWRDAPNAGFCPPEVAPWLPVNPDYARGVNVAAQEDDPNSLLNFYRRLLHLRKTTPALNAGEYQALHVESEAYLAYLRRETDTGQTCLVVLNFSDRAQTVIFDFAGKQLQVLFSSRERELEKIASKELELAPFEVFIAQLQ
jgi:alpha-glucosidase